MDIAGVGFGILLIEDDAGLQVRVGGVADGVLRRVAGKFRHRACGEIVAVAPAVLGGGSFL